MDVPAVKMILSWGVYLPALKKINDWIVQISNSPKFPSSIPSRAVSGAFFLCQLSGTARRVTRPKKLGGSGSGGPNIFPKNLNTRLPK